MSNLQSQTNAPKLTAVFSRCPDCRGSGRTQTGLACAQCRGVGMSARINNTVVYFAHGLDSISALLRRWRDLVRRVLDTLALLSFPLIAIEIIRIGSLVTYEPESWMRLIFIEANAEARVLWVLVIVSLYATFRLYKKQAQKHTSVISYAKNNRNPRWINIADVLSPAMIQTLDEAWKRMSTAGLLPVRPLQLFEALLLQGDIQALLARLGISYHALEEVVRRQIARLTPAEVLKGSLAPETLDCLLQAYSIAYDRRSKNVTPTDMLLAVVRADTVVQDILAEFAIDMTKIENAVHWVNFNNEIMSRMREYRAKAFYKPKGPINRSYTAAATPFLDSFSTDITQQARSGQLPLTVARDKEIEEVFRIIESGRSPLLVGEEGVGKHNVIHGIANKMAAEDVPAFLQDKRLVGISLPFLVAGASHTGEVQERMLHIMNEIARSGNIVLVVEDIHNLVGVSSQGTENIDLSEVLAQAVHGGMVRVIATTTPADAREYLDRGSLSGVLERIIVGEPDTNQTIQILEANVGQVEAQHGAFFTYDALESIVKFSDRYLHEQFLPAKAMSLMAEAGSWAQQRENKIITSEDIAELVSQKTNIPLTQVSKQESDVLLHLEETMHQRIVGQDEAVKLVVSALQRARADLRDTSRPIANLLFLGPTGVGKTELAKTIAASYFGSEDSMIRLDMSEYQVQESIGRLLGQPGQGAGGTLTESVRKTPFALVLLDEIEKAHPDILNIFLQVMDDGRLTDSLGRTIDFTNVILVATSNAEAQYVQDEVRKGTAVEAIKDVLLRERLRNNFRPEFLNRFDGIVVFKPLTEEQVFQIAGLMLAKVGARLGEKGISLRITSAAQRELANAGFDPIFGARPLRRVIQEKVEEALSQFLLTGKIERRDVVVLNEGGEITVEKAQRL